MRLRYATKLKQQLLKLDEDYDKAQECMSRGELGNFKGEFPGISRLLLIPYLL